MSKRSTVATGVVLADSSAPLGEPDRDVMRILAIDIETQPALAYVWGLWDQNISLAQLIEPPKMFCWVAKWIGVDGIEFRSVHHDGPEEMTRRMWSLLDQADVVMHYNGKRFDTPYINREFLRLHLGPPAPYKQIDLLQTARKEFKFASNKLAHVSEQMGLEGKIQHEGFSLWLKCMAGDPEAWDKMREYNVRDVLLLEELYEEWRPWIRSHPSMAAFAGKDVCPGCGGERLESRGYTYTTVGKYRRYRCKDCGRWSRSTKRESGAAITSVPNT